MNKNKLYFKFILNFTFKKIILKKETNYIKKNLTNIYCLFFSLKGLLGPTKNVISKGSQRDSKHLCYSSIRVKIKLCIYTKGCMPTYCRKLCIYIPRDAYLL